MSTSTSWPITEEAAPGDHSSPGCGSPPALGTGLGSTRSPRRTRPRSSGDRSEGSPYSTARPAAHDSRRAEHQGKRRTPSRRARAADRSPLSRCCLVRFRHAPPCFRPGALDKLGRDLAQVLHETGTYDVAPLIRTQLLEFLRSPDPIFSHLVRLPWADDTHGRTRWMRRRPAPERTVGRWVYVFLASRSPWDQRRARSASKGLRTSATKPRPGPMARRRPSQEKKILSYMHDRQNSYGESDKGSRKNIPRRSDPLARHTAARSSTHSNQATPRCAVARTERTPRRGETPAATRTPRLIAATLPRARGGS